MTCCEFRIIKAKLLLVESVLNAVLNDYQQQKLKEKKKGVGKNYKHCL
jgi:hypothetical protein